MSGLKLRKASVSVFSASAGAGKTYRLVAEYIAQALSDVNNPKKFRSILALTFTNKAANEMKRRILETLKEFSEKPNLGTSSDIGATIKDILGISKTELAYRSRAVLQEMLHDYGSIAIGTLDQFTHRLVRAFAIELGLPGKFEVEIEQDTLLDLAVNRLLQDIGKHPSLTELLVQFAKSNIDNEKNSDIFPALLDMSKQLTREDSIHAMKSLNKWSLKQHTEAQDSLGKLENHFQEISRDISLTLLNIFNQIPDEIISHYDWWVNLMSRLTLNDPNGWILSKSLMDITNDPGKIIKKKFVKEIIVYAEALEEIKIQLLRIQDISAKAVLLNEIRRNDRTTSVLAELSKKLESIFEEFNIQPLWKFNQLINDELNSQPAAYIFERIGDRYRHFFIDEAQDTSQLQWENLWPLLENATSDRTNNGSAMIVGDAKQSIYRWRGSNAEEFLNLISKSELKSAPSNNLPSLNGRTEHIKLSDNWRSRRNIVEFNNNLFIGIAKAKEFPSEIHSKAYLDSYQEPKGSDGGRIHARISPVSYGPDKLVKQLEILVQDINIALQENWALSDMVILVRTKKEGREVASKMAQESINIISPELLSLSGSKYVLSIIALMKWMALPNERSRQWELLLSIYEAGIWKINMELLHRFGEDISDGKRHDFNSLLKDILPEFDISIGRQLSLYELGEYLVRALKIDVTPDPFVLSFLDKLHDFSRKKGNYIDAFLLEYSRKKDKWSLSSPDGVDAINVMTIHKSKGLEFPLVFVPFTSFSVKNDEKTWFKLDYDSTFSLDQDSPPATLLSLKSFNKVPLLKSAMENVHPEYVKRSVSSIEERIFDDMNLLYVAFTRAIDGLTIYLTPSTYGDIIISQLKAKYNFDDELIIGAWPSKPQRITTNNSFKLEMNFSKDWTDRVRLAKKNDYGPEQRIGNSVHRVLERIRNPKDLSKAMNITQNEFLWNKEEYDFILNRINAVLTDSRLKKLFEADEVYSERSLIVPGKGIYRPDRLVKCLDGSWVVVDYKTGEYNEKYGIKIKDYAKELEHTLGSLPKTMLLYLRDKIEIYEN